LDTRTAHGVPKKKRRNISMNKPEPYKNGMYPTNRVASYACVSSEDLERYARANYNLLQNKPMVKLFRGENHPATARFLWPEGSLDEIKALREAGTIQPSGGAIEEYDPAIHDALFDARKGTGMGGQSQTQEPGTDEEPSEMAADAA